MPTVKEIKAEPGKQGIKYLSKAKKSDLEELLDGSHKRLVMGNGSTITAKVGTNTGITNAR